MPTDPAVTVFIPTWNAGPGFPATMDAIRRQRLDRPFEVLVVDSGSTDGTAEWLRRGPARLIEIRHADFDHGLTRAMAIREARGQIIALTVQDAEPLDDRWLQHLVDAFDDPKVAGAYSRQVPRPGANPFARWRLAGWMASSAGPRVQSIENRQAFDALPPVDKLRVIGFDNVSAAVRKDVAQAVPFHPGRFGEDLDWSLRVLLAGYRVVYEPRSVVVHSHDRSIGSEFGRVLLDHQNLYRLIGLRAVPGIGSLVWRTAGGTLQLLRAVGEDPSLSLADRVKWWSLCAPQSFAQTLAQYLGARQAARDRM